MSKNALEGLEAAGLNPIIVDENTDFAQLSLSPQRETNEEFIVRILNFGCPTGAMVQPFVLEAIAAYASAVVDNPKAEAFDKNSPIPYEIWQRTAVWLKAELEKKYGSR